jgi:hypothetical protein
MPPQKIAVKSDVASRSVICIQPIACAMNILAYHRLLLKVLSAMSTSFLVTRLLYKPQITYTETNDNNIHRQL